MVDHKKRVQSGDSPDPNDQRSKKRDKEDLVMANQLSLQNQRQRKELDQQRAASAYSSRKLVKGCTKPQRLSRNYYALAFCPLGASRPGSDFFFFSASVILVKLEIPTDTMGSTFMGPVTTLSEANAQAPQVCLHLLFYISFDALGIMHCYF